MEREAHRSGGSGNGSRRAVRLVRHREPLLAALSPYDDAHRDQPNRCGGCAGLAMAPVAQRPAAQVHGSPDHRLHLVQRDRSNRLGPRDRGITGNHLSSGLVRPEPRPASGWPVIQASDRHAPRQSGVPRLREHSGAAQLMPSFLSAHGYDPGPTQRPLLAGGISGVLATAPAIAILYGFGALTVEARILGLSEWGTVAAGCVVMAAAG